MRRIVGILAAALVLGTTGQAMAQKALRLTATLTDPTMCGSQANGDNVATYAYVTIMDSVGYNVATGDKLVYDVLIPNNSTLNTGAVDFEGISNAAGGGTLRDSGAKDQYGLYAHPATDLSKAPKDSQGNPTFVRGKWFHREIALTDQEGGTMDTFIVAFDEHDTTHTQDTCPLDKANPNVIAYFRNIAFVGSDGKVKKALYNGENQFADSQTKKIDGPHIAGTVTNQAAEIVDDPNPQNQ